MIRVSFDREFNEFRERARWYLAQGVRPDEISWSKGAIGLMAEQLDFGINGMSDELDDTSAFTIRADQLSRRPTSPFSPVTNFHVPVDFLKYGAMVAAASDEDRWDLLYRILFRLKFENSDLLELKADGDVLLFYRLAGQVARSSVTHFGPLTMAVPT